jgi:nitric oxide reductase subunit C
MSKKAAFWFFLIGTLSSAALFLVLTFDTHRQVKVLTNADRLSDEVVAGKKVWEKYNCNDCHTILGFGGYYGPDMTKVYRRVGPEGIAYIVRQPDVAFKNSWRKMPKQNVSEEEIGKLVAFFKWISEIDNNDWPPQDSTKRMAAAERRLAGGVGMSRGAALFKTKGCIGCHSIKGVGGDVGPELDGIGSEHDAAFFRKYIPNPQSVDPSSDMPPQSQLTQEEIDALADFLSNLK